MGRVRYVSESHVEFVMFLEILEGIDLSAILFDA